MCIGDQKQDGKKAYSDRWKNVVYEKEAGRTDFVGDWVSKDIAIRHQTTTMHTMYIVTCFEHYIIVYFFKIMELTSAY
jgi:hypothetical protein